VPAASPRNAGGLPQRRRRTRPVTPPMRPKPAASTTTDSKVPVSADPPQAGLWLAAFQEGVSGESRAESPAHRPRGLSDKESEQ